MGIFEINIRGKVMGNCAGYCNGAGENEDGQIRQSFNKQDMINGHHQNNDFENRYGDVDGGNNDPRKGSRMLGKGVPEA